MLAKRFKVRVAVAVEALIRALAGPAQAGQPRAGSTKSAVLSQPGPCMCGEFTGTYSGEFLGAYPSWMNLCRDGCWVCNEWDDCGEE